MCSCCLSGRTIAYPLVFHVILRSRIYLRSRRRARPARSTTALTLLGAVTSRSNSRRACERRQPMGRAECSAANQRAGAAAFERGGRDGCPPAVFCPVSVSCLRKYRPKNRNKMASMLQNVRATMDWQRHLLLADFENERPVPDKFKRKTAFSSLNTICMSLRKRIPLKQVELNFHETPLWENMEARKKSQVLQSITRTARNAFGTVSQKIQKTCQSPGHSTVTFPAEDIGSSFATSFSKKRTVQTPCLSMNSITPAASSKCTPRSSRRCLLWPTRLSEHTKLRGFPSWRGEDAVPLLRSRRASAALKSLYSSPTPASRRIEEFDSELELVSSGIHQLEHLFWASDDDTVQGERSAAGKKTSSVQ
ncbi:protein PIMREG isoform X3 [Meleagris gallopavo]|uniref:protein PIMREG isoform X3 n=1 Tax=Meleagris gallopavo TaxID=9103 RepID=UPI000549CDA3|nr:protein PIMREG isoform X3 [Meleagris gallopavo]